MYRNIQLVAFVALHHCDIAHPHSDLPYCVLLLDLQEEATLFHSSVNG